jgi:sigma-B regulation protein RsbU (phosphoserine phosphatase)
VASALQQAKVYQRTLAQQKNQQELAVARRIQLSFLPKELPHVPGWQLAASLEPAREVAGDFYDLISLPSGGLGILIADVADKGVGPALFMALSRTLMRTFAVQYETRPEKVLGEANRRILQDAGETLFVTVFYGVLDPRTGALIYANAGHNPPWLFRADGDCQSLGATGMPLGIEDLVKWKQGAVQLSPGDVLMLYTDGATDAQNQAGEFYSQDRLLLTARTRLELPASDMQSAILSDIRSYIDGAPQFDDITLLLLKRQA